MNKVKRGPLVRAHVMGISLSLTNGVRGAQVFTNDSWKAMIHGDFDEVMITDSCPAQATLLRAYGAPFEIMSLAPLIAPIVDEEAFLSFASESSDEPGESKGGNRLLRDVVDERARRPKL